MEFTRRIYSGGKLTIPKEVRDLHDIDEGDYVRIELLEVFPDEEPEDEPTAPIQEGDP